MRDPFKKVAIKFEIETCRECPFCKDIYTVGAGRADDYHCCHGKKRYVSDTVLRSYPKIMHYVEYSSDEKPVPDWCPIRTDKK